jgi:hypothetical protein
MPLLLSDHLLDNIGMLPAAVEIHVRALDI